MANSFDNVRTDMGWNILVVKSLFGILLGLVLFFPAYSQQVCIKESTARYYLEVEDSLYVLKKIDSLNTQRIDNLTDQLLVQDSIIHTYALTDSVAQKRSETLLEKLRLKDRDLEKAKAALRRRKILEILVLIGGTILAIAL